MYGIFKEGVIYYLNGYELGTPKLTLKLKELNPTSIIAEMYENIASEALESFNNSYSLLLNQTCRLFKLDDFKKSRTANQMQKQMQIRHIFQHNRGEIRSSDLSDIGREGGSFDILNDEGAVMQYEEGKEIPLSLPEIRKLYSTIEEYSEAFQKQAEKAEPAKAL